MSPKYAFCPQCEIDIAVRYDRLDCGRSALPLHAASCPRCGRVLNFDRWIILKEIEGVAKTERNLLDRILSKVVCLVPIRWTLAVNRVAGAFGWYMTSDPPADAPDFLESFVGQVQAATGLEREPDETFTEYLGRAFRKIGEGKGGG